MRSAVVTTQRTGSGAIRVGARVRTIILLPAVSRINRYSGAVVNSAPAGTSMNFLSRPLETPGRRQMRNSPSPNAGDVPRANDAVSNMRNFNRQCAWCVTVLSCSRMVQIAEE